MIIKAPQKCHKLSWTWNVLVSFGIHSWLINECLDHVICTIKHKTLELKTTKNKQSIVTISFTLNNQKGTTNNDNHS